MSAIDDAMFENKVRLAALALVGIGALYFFPFVLHLLGLEGFLIWLGNRPTSVQWLVLFTMWSLSFVILLGIARGLILFFAALIPAALFFAESIGELIAHLLTRIVFGGGALVAGILRLTFYPVQCVFEALWDYGQTRIGLYLQNWRETQELRRLYRQEFSDQFASFREFKRHFEAEGGGGGHGEHAHHGSRDDHGHGRGEQQREQQEPAPPKADPFAAACRLIGLPEDGSFSAAELKKRYLALMKGVHPDIAGPNELAVQINTANTLIKTRKGWS